MNPGEKSDPDDALELTIPQQVVVTLQDLAEQDDEDLALLIGAVDDPDETDSVHDDEPDDRATSDLP